MSVLIKGLDMPKLKPNTRIKAEIRLLDGRLEFGIMTGGYRCCEQWQYYQIAEVPTPHGRLIDLDKAHLYALDELFDVSPSYITNTEAAKAMMNIYEHMPTVIEAEE